MEYYEFGWIELRETSADQPSKSRRLDHTLHSMFSPSQAGFSVKPAMDAHFNEPIVNAVVHKIAPPPRMIFATGAE